jgi:hypothetical protein
MGSRGSFQKQLNGGGGHAMYEDSVRRLVVLCVIFFIAFFSLAVFSEKFQNLFKLDPCFKTVEVESKNVYAGSPQAVEQTVQEFCLKCSKGFHPEFFACPVKMCLVNEKGDEVTFFDPSEDMHILMRAYVCVPN